ncbi:hypothetical protein APHAL10511_005768 [Amanita phalloides]|nr:hypothetical protein APHAL10511_005768 [Amanita phalloides]
MDSSVKNIEDGSVRNIKGMYSPLLISRLPVVLASHLAVLLTFGLCTQVCSLIFLSCSLTNAHTDGSVRNVKARCDSDSNSLVSIPLIQWAPKKPARQAKPHPDQLMVTSQSSTILPKANSDPFLDESVMEPDSSVTEDNSSLGGDDKKDSEAVEESEDENDTIMNITAAKKKFIGEQAVWSDHEDNHMKNLVI